MQQRRRDRFVHVIHLFWLVHVNTRFFRLIFRINNWSEQFQVECSLRGPALHLSDQPWVIVYGPYQLSEITDCTINASSICPPNWRLTSHQQLPAPGLCYMSEHSPGCRSRCPGWVLVTRCARARCIVCWLFSINLSRKNGSLARRYKRHSQFCMPQWKENLCGMGGDREGAIWRSDRGGRTLQLS